LPKKKQINLNQTFKEQRRLINSITIPKIMEAIDCDVFPIANGVIYEILHTLHRHRREEYLKKDRPSPEKRIRMRKKHSDSRRYDVSK